MSLYMNKCIIVLYHCVKIVQKIKLLCACKLNAKIQKLHLVKFC